MDGEKCCGKRKDIGAVALDHVLIYFYGENGGNTIYRDAKLEVTRLRENKKDSCCEKESDPTQEKLDLYGRCLAAAGAEPGAALRLMEIILGIGL